MRTDSTSSEAAEAKQMAQKSETVAKKSLEVAQACRTDLKALEGRMAALRKIQDDMVLNVSRLQARPTQQQGATAALPTRVQRFLKMNKSPLSVAR